MLHPLFLDLDEVFEIHRDQIERYGGSPGLRDVNLLKSAVAQPSVTFDGQYLHPSLFSMAAAYLFHIVQNHPFIDGNKRVGAVVAIVFLSLNGVELNADETEFEKLIFDVAGGKSKKEQVTEFLRRTSSS